MQEPIGGLSVLVAFSSKSMLKNAEGKRLEKRKLPTDKLNLFIEGV
jgi:hypothetical protein